MSEEKKEKPVPAKPEDVIPEEKAEGEGLKYRFKIAPADPKNSFDFEDVADK